MRTTGLAAVAALLVLAGCATKNYGRMGSLTDYERNTMSCREIDLEIARVDGFVSHVDKESEFDGRSVLSFLGDFGIGNVMEKDAAMKSASDRRQALDSLRSSKQCGYATTTSQPAVSASAPGAASAAVGQ
ncbi:hypothetical protein B7G54_11965 [Burkholderia puraquae]|uniref:Lipoprotein n=1 Tax=Burkholderia puraquae TaxID=1904757 RepID=A0A1X1PIC3_9BURK|nr:hypothetical protein [Burkholderia puraquae]ORT86189.1 hypothetical protein B7G54_11965 [Burkholderia puraquae]CAB3754513.1 hypothetical protein LMG29660_02328 [Burkholderia puraquae]